MNLTGIQPGCPDSLRPVLLGLSFPQCWVKVCNLVAETLITGPLAIQIQPAPFRSFVLDTLLHTYLVLTGETRVNR